MISRPLVVVGAGPAGMSAAIAAARAGVCATVIDDNEQPGGQVHRQPAWPAADRRWTADSAAGKQLLDEFREVRERIEWLGATSVWGLFPPRQLAATRNGASFSIAAEQLILAPGAYEYVPPFPGWTLPGVMTPGAAQLMVKTQGVLPGRRVLVAGSGPFLLVAANQLHRAGMQVAGVVEAAGRHRLLGALAGLACVPAVLADAWRLYRGLKRAGIPFYAGHLVVEARGQGNLNEAAVAPCDANWQADRRRERWLAVDTLCVGYGFVPRIELAQLAGCKLTCDENRGGWVPLVDEQQETSVPGIWVAGDGGGVGGALAAAWQGRLAGLAAVHRLGALDRVAYNAARRAALRKLKRLARLGRALQTAYRLRPDLCELAARDTVVCRCEELTLEEVEAGVAAGGCNLRTLKVITRLGMGPCQGRMCWPALSRWLAGRLRKPASEIGPLSIRPPIQPLTLSAAAAESESAVFRAANTKLP